MFHDAELDRTTIGGSGARTNSGRRKFMLSFGVRLGSINNQPYIGNIEYLWTAKQPKQKLPTFNETIEWFKKPENQHLQFNVSFMLHLIWPSSCCVRQTTRA